MDYPQKSYQLSDEEKVTQVMLYTISALFTGDVVTKKLIRVSTWLRTPMVPQYIAVYSAHMIDISSGSSARQMHFDELFVPFSQVISFHIRPPASDPIDYEPNEPMRKMEPVTALVGPFRFDGYVRMSSQTDLGRYLDVNKEVFTSLYDIEVTPLSLQAMKPFHVPFTLLRRDLVPFSPRKSA